VSIYFLLIIIQEEHYMSRKGIAAAGNLIIDYVKTVDTYPKKGNLYTVFSIEKSVGGGPVNCLVDLAKMDPQIHLQAIGVVGNDNDGEYIIDYLKKYNIDTGMICKDDSKNTSFTDVINEQTGERTFFHYRGANAVLGPQHFDFSKINAEILYIGYILLLDTLDSEDEEYGTVMARVLSEAQSHNLKTLIDVVSENSQRFSKIVPPSLKYTNYCVINEVEASMISGIAAREEEKINVENIKKICMKLFEMGVNDLVVIHCPEAGFAMDKSGTFYMQPSIAIPPNSFKGKVGAGDAFCAGIMYSLYKGWDYNYSLEFASAAAICCLSEANATDGMKSVETIRDMIINLPKEEISFK